jgi:hypothetical protein
VATGARLRLGCDDMCTRRWGRAPVGVAVGAGARLRVGRAHLCIRRHVRAPGGDAVGTGAPRGTRKKFVYLASIAGTRKSWRGGWPNTVVLDGALGNDTHVRAYAAAGGLLEVVDR